MRTFGLAALAAASLSVAFAAAASAADYYGGQAAAPMYADALVPACTDPKVLSEVEDQFEYGAPRMLQADLAISEFRDPFEKAYFPKTISGSMERRYCQSEAVVSDGVKRTVYYVVTHPMGFAGLSWKAEGCVLGLDKWMVYGANCQSLRRF